MPLRTQWEVGTEQAEVRHEARPHASCFGSLDHFKQSHYGQTIQQRSVARAVVFQESR